MTETRVPCRTLTAVEATVIGDRLRRRRRDLGLRVRHLATDRVPAGQLRAIERGAIPLDGAVLTEVASTYGVDLAVLVPHRPPLDVENGQLHLAGRVETFAEGSLTSAVQAYLALMDADGGPAEPGMPLHRDDITQLADHLDLPCMSVLSRVADQMGADGARTRAMVTLYLEGASVIGVY